MTLGYAKSCLDLGKDDENKGILLTGDIAKRDKDGFYFIVGRKKRFLKILGNRVSLDEIEELIKALGVECACTGTDDIMKIYITQPDAKKRVLSYVVECTGINRSKLIIQTLEKLPRNESGKVQYPSLGVN